MYKFYEEKKINIQQVSWKKSARHKLHKQKQERNTFHDHNRFQMKKNRCTSFTKKKINIQEFSRVKITAQHVTWTKSTQNKFHEQKQI